MSKLDMPKVLYDELFDLSLKMMAENNCYCGIDDILRILLKAWKMNPLLAATVTEQYFAMSS